MKKLFETRFQRFNWERDAGTGRLLSDVGSMASRMSPEELRELTERCLAHSSYEIAAWLRDAAAVGRLPGPLPELEETIDSIIRKNAGEEMNWSDLKTVLLTDRRELFRECFLARIRALYVDAEVGQPSRRRQKRYISLLSDPLAETDLTEAEQQEALSLTPQEIENRRLINLRYFRYMAEALDDSTLYLMIRIGHNSFSVTTREEAGLYNLLCRELCGRAQFSSARLLYRLCNSRLPVISALGLDTESFLDRYLPGTAPQARDELMYHVREQLEKDLGDENAANEAWYQIVLRREELADDWFALVYWLIRFNSQPGREAENIREMPRFQEKKQDRTLRRFRAYNLMNKFHRRLLESAPENFLTGLAKTAAYNLLESPEQIVWGKKEFRTLTREQLDQLGCEDAQPLPFLDKKNQPDCTRVVSSFLAAGHPPEALADAYTRTTMRVCYPMNAFLADLFCALGSRAFRALDLRRMFDPWPIYAIITSSDPEEGVLFSFLTVRTRDIRRHWASVPTCAQARPGDFVRVYVTGFSSGTNRLYYSDPQPLLSPGITEVPGRVAGWEREMNILASSQELTEGRLRVLAATASGFNHKDFTAAVRLNLLAAGASAPALGDRGQLDEYLYLIHRKMNDQFSFNPFKKRPDFYLPNSQPQRQQARRIWEALCALSAPSANKLTVYMETVLRDLIPLSEALLTLFPLREGESADLTDPADPERYWFHGGTQRNPDKPRQVFQLELAWDDRVRMYPEDHAAVQLRSFAPDSPVICHLSRVRREWGLVQVFYDRILPAEDADQVMPDSAFLDAIYTLGKDGAAGLTQRQRQRLASDQVRLRGVRLEYAAFLQLRVLSADTLGRAPRGLADYDLLLSLAGERLPFTEDGDTDVSSLRFPELLGRAEAIVTALTEICSPPVALHYYMNSLLKACVSLEALCSKLAFSAPEEELRHFFTRYPLRLAEEGGVLRSKNILCRSFRFTEGGGPGLYTLTGYDPRSGAVLLSPVSQSGSST